MYVFGQPIQAFCRRRTLGRTPRTRVSHARNLLDKVGDILAGATLFLDGIGDLGNHAHRQCAAFTNLAYRFASTTGMAET